MKKLFTEKSAAASIIFAVTLILVLVFPFSRFVEYQLEDLRFKLRGSIPIDRNIIIVTVDEESFEQINQRWPWPRSLFARGVDRIAEDNPRVIGFDIMLSEKGFSPEQDTLLAQAFTQTPMVVLPEKLQIISQNGKQITNADTPVDIYTNTGVVTGYVNLPVDSDGTVRKVFIRQNVRGKRHLAFGAAIAEQAGADLLKTADLISINFAGPPGSFFTVSFSRLLDGSLGEGFFKDKIVLIGAGFIESQDFQKVSTSTGDSRMTGVEIHANVVNTLVTGQTLQSWNGTAYLILVLAAALVLSVAGIKMKPGFTAAGYTLAGVLWLLAGWFLFIRKGVILPSADLLLTLLLTAVGSVIWHYLEEAQQRRQIHSVFSRYVSPSVVQQLMNEPERVKLGGENRTVTLLFSDIRGFTTLSERMNPKEVVKMLNEYFTAMTDILFQNNGTLNKYIGDAIFAFFGAPVDQDDTALRGVKTALEMRRALANLNQKRKAREAAEIKIGIGLHKGEVLVGNIGSDRQMEYTVIGDAVNVCSRIESYTKEVQTDILISDSVYLDVKQQVRVETLPPVLLKGKKQDVVVHKLIEGTEV